MVKDSELRSDQRVLVVDGLEVLLLRKDIKNVRITVKPPKGSVILSAPRFLGEEEALRILASKKDWIRAQREKFAGRGNPQAMDLATGEEIDFQGRRYLLKVVETAGEPGILDADGTTLELRVKPGSDRAVRIAVLEEWYRKSMDKSVAVYLRKWERIMKVASSKIVIRRMKTKWGSCNTRSGRINLNLELIRRPPACLEFVIVHELCHLLEDGHGKRFYKFMDKFLPDWKRRKAVLNEEPLG